MLCLALCCPGRIGKLIRRIFLPVIAVIIIYVVAWIAVVDSLKFTASGSETPDGQIKIEIDVRNKAYVQVKIVHFKVYSTDGTEIKCIHTNTPLIVQRRGKAKVITVIKKAKMKTTGIKIKALGFTHEFKSPIKSK